MTSKIVGGIGAAAILAAAGELVSKLSSPDFLLSLIVAIRSGGHNDPQNTIVTVLASTIGLLGAVGVTILAAWLSGSPLEKVQPPTPEKE